MKTERPIGQPAGEAISRRNFLGNAAAITTFMVLEPTVLGRAGETSPNRKLNIAGIGIGGQGAWDLEQVNSENIVALCDVDENHAAHTFNKYPGAKRYKDFREMLDKEKSIDAVVVGTPDHAHAIVSVTAMKMGKHVYCEKPLTHTVYEARTIADLAARNKKLATQMGNQGTADSSMRRSAAVVRSGALGTVKEVQLINPHSWIYLEVKNDKGETVMWALEATAPGGLARAGVKKGDLRPGDTIKVRCNQLRDGSNGCLLGFVTPTHGDKARGDGIERDWDGPRAGADPRDALAK